MAKCPLLVLWMAPPSARECNERGPLAWPIEQNLAAVRWSRLALRVIRGAAKFGRYWNNNGH
jgi:hypothetical protein